MKKREKIEILTNYLKSLIKDVRIELDYETDFQLLIAVLMSAQTTDIQVNKVNKEFFKYLREPKDVNILWVEKITKMISSIGFYRNKAKNIYATWNILIEKYNSKIPDNLEDLTALPGVWVKTAKVVLSTLYDKPYLAVDTHVHRVLNRVWLVKTKIPEETDKKVDKLFDDKDKRELHHLLILFWRYHCKAQNPDCKNCKIKEICVYKNKNLD